MYDMISFISHSTEELSLIKALATETTGCGGGLVWLVCWFVGSSVSSERIGSF